MRSHNLSGEDAIAFDGEEVRSHELSQEGAMSHDKPRKASTHLMHRRR
ncbi:MAG: hypothetical protein ICV78_02560 [Tolypothrix sp. Co-bin9]|nr:hypothetical protein [Tolypothrix sp. Co-bin9]